VQPASEPPAQLPTTLPQSPPPMPPVARPPKLAQSPGPVASQAGLPPVSPYAPTVKQQAYTGAPYDPFVHVAPPRAVEAPASRRWIALVIAVAVLVLALVIFLILR
jgi:hypothetical protein